MQKCTKSPNKKHMYKLLPNVKFSKDYTSYIGCIPTEYVEVDFECTECQKKIDNLRLSTEMLIGALFERSKEAMIELFEIDKVWW